MLDFAEAPARFTAAGADAARTDEGRYVLLATEGHGAVQGIRLAADGVADAVAACRSFMRENGAFVVSWWLCERSTPGDVEERLLELGLSRLAGDYEVAGMLLTHEPPPGPAEVAVHRVRSAGEFAAARLLQYEVFAIPRERRLSVEGLQADFERGVSGETYVALLDGRLAGAARAFFGPQGAILAGGATASWARGRGAYRALVRARWDDVVARGGEALVVQAGSLSAPILARLGFETVHRFRRLEDVLPRS